VANPLYVLIADDDPDIREMVRTALQLDGHAVLEAPDGQTAWKLIVANRPVLVLTDVQMPGIDGLELTALIKANGYDETKVILFTGGMATEWQAQRAGADAYVTKSAPLPASHPRAQSTSTPVIAAATSLSKSAMTVAASTRAAFLRKPRIAASWARMMC